MFLELVRRVSQTDTDLARAALQGLATYERAERPPKPPAKRELARVRGACLRDHGGDGPPAILVPSLINPPRVLDLDQQTSLAGAVARMGRRSLLLDWGSAEARGDLSIAGHVEELLLPLIGTLDDPPALVGYCLGGTMTIAAAALGRVDRLVTLAAPWHFSRYPEAGRAALRRVWDIARPAAERLGALPMEVLQAAFWSLDPHRTVAKFADFAAEDPASRRAARFIALEDWANEGEPLPLPAAAELLDSFFGCDRPGSARWQVAGRPVPEQPTVPTLHLTAARDRIAPAATSAGGKTVQMDAGHVGMVIGHQRRRLHDSLRRFLDPLAAGGARG